MNMTLDEAIRHSEEIAETFLSQGVNEEHCRKCGEEHAQLAEWLKELKARRGCVVTITKVPELSAEEVAKLMRNSGPLTIMTDEPSSITIDDWVPTMLRQPPKPTGPEWYNFEGVDIAADEYNVMIEGATLPTSAHWTGSCWFDPYGPIEQLLPVIAWRPLPDPPSWALQDSEHEEDGLPFPEAVKRP